jgi:uncharacterized protein (DUF1697 family)
MARMVAFLRGINLARNARVAMADLRALLEDLGYEDVRTHLQSGNAALTTAASAADVERAVEGAMRDRLGIPCAAIVRTGAQLGTIVRADRLGDVADDPAKRLVVFLRDRPPTGALAPLLDADFGDERIAVAGREVYMWLPGGFATSRLRRAAAKVELVDRGTARNWRTVARMAELSAA